MFNNYSFGTLTQLTNDDSYSVSNPDYDKLASAFGLHYRLADENNFTEIIKECTYIKNSHCFIEVRVSKDPILFNKLRYK